MNWRNIILKSIPIIFIIIVILTLRMLFKMNNKLEDEMYNYEQENYVEENNEIPFVEETKNEVENVLNEVKNEVKNETKNEVKNTNKTKKETKNTISEQKREQINTIDNKEKAVELVKKIYDKKDGTVFYVDSMLNTGEYLVASKNPESSQVTGYFKVDVETETVESIY